MNKTIDIRPLVGSSDHTATRASLEWQYDPDESQPETRSVKEGLFGPKTKIRLLGAWNVRTMYETSKTAEVLGEMKRRNLDILGIRECRWTGSGPSCDE